MTLTADSPHRHRWFLGPAAQAHLRSRPGQSLRDTMLAGPPRVAPLRRIGRRVAIFMPQTVPAYR